MADASYPNDLLYHPEHDWARIDPDVAPPEATLGITWYAQDQLGEIVFCEPPALGTTVTRGEPYAEVESVKAVSDVIAPLSGEIVSANESLADEPEKLNDDPYGEGWLVRIRLTDPSEREELLDAGAYAAGLGG
ncbi:MAG TPA: glycine cleavage system protein GcvH [Solirubrobacteraceae bacterium]|jgi:glycine cleavage system H protein|nr:glycine cleavage system protein GcvH [Solirubrobacteraceae bacterium]